MLDLPGVTLCCVDTREPALALAAMARSAAGVRYGDALLVTNAARAPAAPPGVRVVDARIPSAAAYSEFLIKGLAAHVCTGHVLVVQWDGWVLDPARWDPEFLAYDYVGPRWADVPAERSVGNGGFSLRSRRLLDALQDPRVVPAHPEDVCIARDHRDRLAREHGVRFAPPALADRFAFERLPPAGPTFGFHGLYNAPRALGAAALAEFLAGLPAALLGGREGKDLCKALVRAGHLGHAGAVLRARRTLGPPSGVDRRLAARLAWARAARALGAGPRPA